MRGVVFPGERAVETMTFPDPTPGPGEVVLEMKASGMCGSDLHQYRRPKNLPRTGTGIPANPDPVIAGHEPCGVVVAVGAGVTEAEARIGDRMMVHHYQGCTQCSHCRSGSQPRSLTLRPTSIPSMSGSIQSSTIRSGSNLIVAASASRPVRASSTSNPS